MTPARESALYRRQEVLTKFGELALRSEDLDDILNEACRLVGDGLDTGLMKVMELLEDGRTLRLRAGFGWPSDVVGRLTVVPGPGSVEAYVLGGHGPAVSCDISGETRFAYPESIAASGVRSLVTVVIMGPADSEPYGVLQVGSRGLRDFTGKDAEFLRGYANMIAAAVRRVQVLAETRRNEQRLRVMLEGLPQLVWRSNDQGNVSWVSPQWTAYTGLSGARSCLQGWLHAVHAEDRPVALRSWDESLFCGRVDFECRLLNNVTGHYVWFRFQALPRRDVQGGIIEWIGSSTNIDEQVHMRGVELRRLEQLERSVAARTVELQGTADRLRNEICEHRRTEDQLRQSEKLKAIGQLTGGIAHDFNNILQSITSTLDIVQICAKKNRISELHSYIDRAFTAVERAAALVQRLMSFARVQRLDPKMIVLDQVTSGMEEMLRRVVGPTIRTEVKPVSRQPNVVCDVNQLESALLNLCVNARDAMPDGGWLTVTTDDFDLGVDDLAGHDGALPGHYACVVVSDTGTGIVPDIMAHIFEPFYTTKPFGQGTGLGLSQIYGFVRQSGGIIQTQSTVGIGTTIRLCFPVHCR